MIKTIHYKAFLALVVTAFLVTQWSPAHIHLAQKHEHDGHGHQHELQQHVHDLAGHHADNIDDSHESGDGNIISLGLDCTSVNCFKLDSEAEKATLAVLSAEFVFDDNIKQLHPFSAFSGNNNLHARFRPRAPPLSIS